MISRCKWFSTKWCICYCKKFGKYVIHLVTNLEWIKQLIHWKTVRMTTEWYNDYAIIDPGTQFIFRNFSSFIKKIASTRIMAYSFNCVPKPWCTEKLNCLGPLTNSMCNWATDRRPLFIVCYFSTMCVDVVWVQVVFKIWVNFYMPPWESIFSLTCNKKGTVSNSYVLSSQCSTQ